MLGIKKITYKYNNDDSFIINALKNYTLTYKNIEIPLSEKSLLNYLESLYKITNTWQSNYKNPTSIDGVSWNLSISFEDNTIINYSGKGDFPNNFEAFERMNYALIKEVF